MLCQNYTSIDSDQLENNQGIFKRYFREFFYQLDQSRQGILAKLSILPDFSVEEIKNNLIKKLIADKSRLNTHPLSQQHKGAAFTFS